MRETEVNRGRWGGEKSKDILWLSAAVALVFLFLLPILLGWHGIFGADINQLQYPNTCFLARNIKQLIVPLWDPSTYAGAFTFYTRWEGLAFYLPQWLASLPADVRPSHRAYRDLQLLPIVGHFIWAALGAFMLGRWGLKLSRVGSFMLALAFALSGSFLFSLNDPTKILSQAWHPWLVGAVLLYARRQVPGRLVLGALIIALAAPAWPIFTIQGLMLAFFFGVTAVIRSAVRKDTKSALRLAGGLFLMGALGLLLAAPFWWSLIDGTAYVNEVMKRSLWVLTEGARSVPGRWFATLFVPELFSSSKFAYMWGIAKETPMYWSEAFLPRGMLLWFPAVLVAWSGIVWMFKLIKGRGSRERYVSEGGAALVQAAEQWSEYLPWIWLSSGLIVFSILLLAGRHTPVFPALYRICPLFKMPYATRWYPFLTMGYAILTGIGVTRLLKSRPEKILVTRRRILAYILFVTLFALFAVSWPFGYWEKLTDVRWFIRAPVLYWFVCVLLLGLLCSRRLFRRAGRIIVILALFGILRDACWSTYRPKVVTWGAEQEEVRGPEDNKLNRFMEFASNYNREPMTRTGYSLVFADNTALIYGGNSFLGVAIRPMLPRMYRVLHGLCKGLPYEITLRDPTLPFVGNMSGGLWWYDDDTPPSPQWKKVADHPESGLTLFRIPGALPRVFTHDRLHPGSEENLRFDLVHRDLREAVGVDGEDDRLAGIVSRQKWELKTRAQDGIAPEDLAHFEELQEINRIRKVDFGNPNRVTIEIDIDRPAMLVLTDAWHSGWEATDNGRPTPVFRVNHVQRGVWLEKGRHTVRMEFRPAAVYTGRWITLAGVVFAVFLLLGVRLGKGSY